MHASAMSCRQLLACQTRCAAATLRRDRNYLPLHAILTHHLPVHLKACAYSFRQSHVAVAARQPKTLRLVV
jgi:hypothetical protein